MPSKSQYLRPRLCTLEKGDNGYGFHLHGEKGKTGQFIRLVEPDSPAETSGLRAGDRLVYVNGEDVENESHQQVVSRIRATVGWLELIVVDPDTEQLLKKHNLKCLKAFVTDGVPLPFEEEEVEEVVVVEKEEKTEEDEVVVEEKQEDGEVNGTENGDEPREEEVMEEVKQEETPEETTPEETTPEETTPEETPEETPRESTPIPETNGQIHGHVEKKLSIRSEKVRHLKLVNSRISREFSCTKFSHFCVVQMFHYKIRHQVSHRSKLSPITFQNKSPSFCGFIPSIPTHNLCLCQ